MIRTHCLKIQNAAAITSRSEPASDPAIVGKRDIATAGDGEHERINDAEAG